MKTFTIKPRPDLLNTYSAIDGIEQSAGFLRNGQLGLPYEDAVRSDVFDILHMDDEDFEAWCKERQTAIDTLSTLFKVAGSVPDLRFPAYIHTIGTADSAFSSIITALERAKDHLDLMRKVREEDSKE